MQDRAHAFMCGLFRTVIQLLSLLPTPIAFQLPRFTLWRCCATSVAAVIFTAPIGADVNALTQRSGSGLGRAWDVA